MFAVFASPSSPPRFQTRAHAVCASTALTGSTGKEAVASLWREAQRTLANLELKRADQVRMRLGPWPAATTDLEPTPCLLAAN